MNNYDYVKTLMKENLDNFMKTLPDFLNEAKNECSSFSKRPIVFSKRTVVFNGTIDHVIMREWCKLVSKNFLPFKFGMSYNYDNDIYKSWDTCIGCIYVSARYLAYKSSDPLELTWGFMELKDGE